MRKLVLALLLAAGLRADIIIFENGDRLSGEVLTLTGSELKLRNEVQGVITLPRAKIASIHFREPAAAPIPAIPPAATPLKGIQGKDDTARAIEQVQNQLLAGATPEAQQMYQEMVTGFLSGQLSVEDIRHQAQQALTELRSLEGELGDDETTALLKSYAAILENFLKASPPGTNATRKAIPSRTLERSAPAPSQN